MHLFLDTAIVEEVEKFAATGLVFGVTTNPSLAAKTGLDFHDLIRSIASLVEGPVSAEVTALDADQMVTEGRQLAKIADNVIIKVPATWDGLTACSRLSAEGIGVNVTLCFTLNQAILAAQASAQFISPFVGRLEDAGANGIGLIEQIAHFYKQSLSETLVLAASLRHSAHVEQVALAGADAATIPPSVFQTLFDHELTTTGLEKFMADWQQRSIKK